MISALKFRSAGSSSSPVASHTFDAFLRALETDTPEKKRCRELKASGSGEYQAHKRNNVPAWTLGARFTGPRSNDNAIAEGYVTVDFDDVPDCVALKNALSQCPHVLLAAKSVGARGVFCVIPTTPEIQKSPEKIKILWRELSNYTGIPVGAKDAGAAHIDSACSDTARLRYESYDPCYVYNPDAAIWKPFCELAYECYAGSALYEIAQCFGGAPDPGRENNNARNAFALAALSMIARGRVYGESSFLRGRYFPFRAQTVVLGRSGANKTVTLDALHAAASAFGVREILSASDAALIDAIAKSAAVSEGKGENMTWTPRPAPLPLLEVIDEAGDDKAARSSREYTSQAADLRRRLFNETASLSNALSRPAPDFPVKSAYTNIQLSTPERWAESVNAGDGAAGDARRVAEFWAPSPVDNAETADPAVVGRLMRLSQAQSVPANADRLICLLQALDSRGGARLPSNVCDWVLDGALPYLGGAHPEETVLNVTAYQTLAVSFATACAYARGGDRIEDRDFRAGASLFLGVLETRKRLAPLACSAVETQQSAITDLIIKLLRAAGDGGVRLDKLTCAGGKCASPDHAKVLHALIADGVIIRYKGTAGGRVRSMLRLATEEEIAKREEALPDFSAERVSRDKVARNSAVQSSAPAQAIGMPFDAMRAAEYAQADAAGKRAKLDAYRAEHEREPGHEIIEGQRDKSLRSLATKLHNAGLDDDFAYAWFCELCSGLGGEFARSGVPRRLWRPAPKRA